MRVNEDFRECNAEAKEADSDSVLAFCRKMVALRRECADLFIFGEFEDQDPEDLSFFTFTKVFKGRKAAVL